MCHYNFDGGGPRNPYGAAFEAGGKTLAALIAIEGDDSDGDGFSNIDEITNAAYFPNSPTFPGLSSANDDLVSTVDPASVRILDVAPLRWSYEDVTTPYEPAEECDCGIEGPDGILDLSLKFKNQELAAALGAVSDGDLIPVTLTGNLKEEFGGDAICGMDCFLVRLK